MITSVLPLLSACIFFPEAGTWPVDTGTAVPLDTWIAPNLLLGAYSPLYLGTPERVQAQLQDWDAEVSQRLSLGGVFVGVEDPNPAFDLPAVFGTLHEAGYTPFVNLASVRSIAELESGDYDDQLWAIAQATAAWLDETPEGMLFFAPLPEMNGDWENYSFDAEGYKRFFPKLRTMFDNAGVRPGGVRWVFAPNGWSPRGLEFEKFYPGDDVVDAVGFSAYQWGGCRNTSWQNPDDVYGEFIERMGRMAPDKPLFVTQTASTSTNDIGVSDEAAKNAFLIEGYRTLADARQVLGVMYFNIDKECDWAVWDEGVVSDGYRTAVTAPGIAYVAPGDLEVILPEPAVSAP